MNPKPETLAMIISRIFWVGSYELHEQTLLTGNRTIVTTNIVIYDSNDCYLVFEIEKLVKFQ